MQSLTKPGMKEIREAVDAALEEVGKDLGVGLMLGNGSFTSTEGHFRLNVTVLGEGGKVESPEAKAWPVYCTAYGFKAEDLGAVFHSQGKAFKITGIKPSRSQYPISGERVPDGKGFKFPVAQVLRALGREVPAGLEFARRRRGFGYGFED